ncbi:hypothetical protein HDV00_000355 [Rhizophlyctis rosea]|nr:hypothetical protein HDV00_000355 [Rhizophlyctis rosea]
MATLSTLPNELLAGIISHLTDLTTNRRHPHPPRPMLPFHFDLSQTPNSTSGLQTILSSLVNAPLEELCLQIEGVEDRCVLRFSTIHQTLRTLELSARIILEDLSQSAPNLISLKLEQESVDDYEDYCPNLRSLRLPVNDYHADLVIQLISTRPSLEEIHFRTNFVYGKSDVGRIEEETGVKVVLKKIGYREVE